MPAGYGSSSWRDSIRNTPRAARDEVDAGRRASARAPRRSRTRSRSAAARRRRARRSRTPTPPPGSARSSPCSAPRRCAAGPVRSAARRGPAGTAGSPGPAATVDPVYRPGSVTRTMARPLSSGSGATCACTITRRCARRSTRCERVVPVFVLDDRLLDGRHASGSRDAFMLECLRGPARRRCSSAAGTSSSLAARPSRSCRSWRASTARPRSTSPPTPRRSRWRRDQRVEEALREAGVEPRRTPGNFVADIGKPKPYAVFTPFWRAWKELPRREIHGAPRKRPVPSGPARRRDPGWPKLAGPSRTRCRAARRAGRKRMHAWLRDGIDDLRRAPRPRSPAARRMLSPYLHFGCVSRARARGAGRPPRRLHPPARLARLLRPRPAAQPGQRPATPTARELDAIEWDGTRRALRRLARGPHGLSDRRRRACASSRRPAGCTTAPA